MIHEGEEIMRGRVGGSASSTLSVRAGGRVAFGWDAEGRGRVAPSPASATVSVSTIRAWRGPGIWSEGARAPFGVRGLS
jgi:hypothetical protein